MENNIRITNRRIRLAKLGYIHYHISKKYKKILKSSKINNVTVKQENGKYYAIVNITTTVEEFNKTGENIGIDLGFKSLAIFNNSLKIDNLDLKKEDQMISKYQKKLARQEYMSKNYKKTLNKIHKWQNRKNNKKQNEYHHLSKQIVKKFDIISMENLNIAGMFIQKVVSKITKNQPSTTSKHDKIQITMVWKNIHTNRQIFPINTNMQHM